MAHELQIEERVAVLKRLKSHLLMQREKFHTYLDVLGKEEESIRQGNLQALAAQVELEKSIVEEIYSLGRVINPLQDLYRMAYPLSEPEIPSLQKSLETIRTQVLAHNERNRNLLKESMAQIRQEIASLRTSKMSKSPFGDVPSPSMIDIRT